MWLDLESSDQKQKKIFSEFFLTNVYLWQELIFYSTKLEIPYLKKKKILNAESTTMNMVDMLPITLQTNGGDE